MAVYFETKTIENYLFNICYNFINNNFLPNSNNISVLYSFPSLQNDAILDNNILLPVP